jgi:hypothetical protein
MGVNQLPDIELGKALAEFKPVSASLMPSEQGELLNLLLERIQYDGAAGSVTRRFCPNGFSFPPWISSVEARALGIRGSLLEGRDKARDFSRCQCTGIAKGRSGCYRWWRPADAIALGATGALPPR